MKIVMSRITSKTNKGDAINAAAHEDMVLLMKEYARKGFKEAHRGTGKDFEKLWLESFPSH